MTYLIIRPDSWNLPLFVHVAGAMAVTAAVFIAVAALVLAWRAAGEQREALTRFAFRTLLFGGIPAWFVMRIGAEWIYSREPYKGDTDTTWVGVGYIIAELHLHPARDDPHVAGRAAPPRRRWGWWAGEGRYRARDDRRRTVRRRDLGDDDQAELTAPALH